jgi:hypothetical protein
MLGKHGYRTMDRTDFGQERQYPRSTFTATTRMWSLVDNYNKSDGSASNTGWLPLRRTYPTF